MSDQYREQMALKLQAMLTPDHQKILYIGDPLDNIADLCKKEGRECVFVNNQAPEWMDISREQPTLSLDLPEKHFDLLIVYHALEQTLDPERLLLQLRKYVQPEGQCFIVAFNIGHISTVVNLLTEGWEYQDDGALRHHHVRYFSNESLRYLLDQVGFEFTDEVVYQMMQEPSLTKQLIQSMKNPYLSIFSFIMVGRKINTFPFIDFEEDTEKEPPVKRLPHMSNPTRPA